MRELDDGLEPTALASSYVGVGGGGWIWIATGSPDGSKGIECGLLGLTYRLQAHMLPSVGVQYCHMRSVPDL